jgi:hypothetical protein
VFEAGYDLEATSYPLWTLARETVTRLANDCLGELAAVQG